MKTIVMAAGVICAALWGTNVFAAQEGIAFIKGTSADSNIHGKITLSEKADGGLEIKGKIAGLPPGEHGFHIHEFGSCDDSGKAAGDHYNPKNVQHGLLTKDGLEHAHAGDFGNITAKDDGIAEVNVTAPGLALGNGPYTVGGRALIVHEKPDDFGQPLGNAGGRIGCGSIILRGK